MTAATIETDQLQSSRAADSSDLDLLKPREVAKALRTTENGLRRWRAAGIGPAVYEVGREVCPISQGPIWLSGCELSQLNDENSRPARAAAFQEQRRNCG
jgi:hypothetical protein